MQSWTVPASAQGWERFRQLLFANTARTCSLAQTLHAGLAAFFFPTKGYQLFDRQHGGDHWFDSGIPAFVFTFKQLPGEQVQWDKQSWLRA